MLGTALAPVLSACGPAPVLRIGLLGGLSGSVADLGEAARAGAQLAMEQANAAGGVNGRAVELLPRDDAQDPERARAALAAFISEGVAAVIGPMTSAMAEAVLPLSMQSGLVLISPTVSASRLQGRDDTLFMALTSTRHNASQAAHYHQSRGYRRVAAFYDTRNLAFTQDWLGTYRESVRNHGGRVVQALPFASGQQDSYLEAVRQLQGRAADAVLYLANAVDTVRLLLLVRQAGWRMPALGVTWSATGQLLELGGREVEGMSSIQLFDRELMTPRYQAFLRAYRERFTQEPGFASIAAYDTAQALIQALRARQPDQNVKQALLQAGPYEGLQERWNFDVYGDVQRRQYVSVVKDGRFVTVN
ncbi:MAG: ABC transporter substrate-binding protein [Hylemonella sp.]|uniref:ABC transporter substrate-binding protein n=1 Tax=Hylemonella sp. TaxID=2066020 RepID=UPI0022CC06F5|nr:ABC transporter substrate-binding protein [Hylemonella sp.]MCZ8251182.1 ABC transporter substrate-binding protein [Hylemonella sp.]